MELIQHLRDIFTNKSIRTLIYGGLLMSAGGGVYALSQVATFGNVADSRFIIFLVLAAWLQVLGTLYIRMRVINAHPKFPAPKKTSEPFDGTLKGLWHFVLNGADSKQDLLNRLFAFQPMLLCGLGYGVFMAMLAFFLVDGYSGIEPARVGLGVFVFTVNLITGAVLYSLSLLLCQAWHWADQMDGDIFHRNSEQNGHHSKLLRSLNVIVAADIALVLTCMQYSLFNKQQIYQFSAYSVLILLAIFHVPRIPLKKKIQEDKDRVLRQLAEAKSMLFQTKPQADNFEEWERLENIEAKVTTIKPKFGEVDARIAKYASFLGPVLPITPMAFANMLTSESDLQATWPAISSFLEQLPWP